MTPERYLPDDDLALPFLRPSTKPGSLGRLKRYEVVEVIGRGGCGIVLKAIEDLTGRSVAIKVMDRKLAAHASARRRFLDEAHAACINHENVIIIYAVEEDPTPFIAMKYIEGQTLQRKLDQSGPFDLGEVVQIGYQIARGLGAAHAEGLVHRDIKPANILLEKATNCVIIVDFGLARAMDDTSPAQRRAHSGTPLYMSPELAQGNAKIDHRSDLFSLGSVLYVMLTGKPPFHAATIPAILKRVAQDQPQPIQEINRVVPLWLIALIAKLHAKEPSERFATAHEVANELRRHATSGEPVTEYRSQKETAETQFAVAASRLGLHTDLNAARKGMEDALRDLFNFSLDDMNWTDWPHQRLINDPVDAATRLRRFGDSFRTQGDADRALKLYRIVQRLLDNAGPTEGAECERGKLLSSLVEHYLRLGKTHRDLQDAKQFGLKSISCHEKQHRLFEKENPLFNEQYRLLKKQESLFELFQSHRVLADVCLALNETAEAKNNLDRAQDYWKSCDAENNEAKRRLVGWLMRSRGDLHAAQGRWSCAKQEYESALTVFQRDKDPFGMAISREKIGDMDGKLGNHQKAAVEIAEAIRIVKGIPGAEHLLERMQNSFKLGRIGVASSVSAIDGKFDQLLALDYAAKNHFSPVQIYLDPQLVKDPSARENIRVRAQEHGLSIMLHAPGLLRPQEAKDLEIVHAALDLLNSESSRRVVYHFDETQSVEDSLAIVEWICELAIVPCIENFHPPHGADNAQKNYANYIDLLSRIRNRSLNVIPVIDVPRTFHEALGLTTEAACALMISVLRRIGEMGYPVLFHLIDATSSGLSRNDWCPIGKGIIPYAHIFRSIAGTIRCDDVILEFEDYKTPLLSRQFLSCLPYSHADL